MAIQIQLRRDTAANWTSVNPILAVGELGLETDTGKFKVGNGSTAWASRPYNGFTTTNGISIPGEFEQGYTDDGDKTGATSVALTAGNSHRIRMTGNVTLSVTAATSGRACSLTLILVQDATGSRLMTWPTTTKWEGGAPTLSTVAASIDIFTLITYDGGTTWYGFLVGKGMA